MVVQKIRDLVNFCPVFNLFSDQEKESVVWEIVGDWMAGGLDIDRLHEAVRFE